MEENKIKDGDFIKLTKKQKLELPQNHPYQIDHLKIALFIPLKRKNNSYTMCAFFVKNDKGLWFRLDDYDCFRFVDSHSYLKGDFENHGVQFFLGDEGNWISDYGGEFRRY